MRDANNLSVTAINHTAIDLINKITEFLFRKQSGIELLLPDSANQYVDCPLLQMLTAMMFFFSFSRKIIDEKFPFHII